MIKLSAHVHYNFIEMIVRELRPEQFQQNTTNIKN